MTALVVLVAAVARASHQAPPPTIAEFAPQAVAKIEDPPPNLSSSAGRDGGGLDAGAGGDAVGSTAVKDTDPAAGEDTGDKVDEQGVEVPRRRRCVGSPPRQTEDPQSPPCVAFWDASNGNGGATAKGVTETEIRIVVPQLSGTGYAHVLRDFETYFNNRYELYGRKLKLIGTADEFTGSDPVQVEKATAANADAVHKAFASTDTEYNTGRNYREELAGYGIISVAEQPYVGEDQMARKGIHPYAWSYPMDTDTMLRMVGEWMCKRLAPFNVNYTDDPLFAGQPRRFGLIAQEIGGTRFQADRYLEPVLAACGVKLADRYITDRFSTTASEWQTIMSRFKVENDVSSILCLCYITDLATAIGPAATNQAYFPEWLVTPYFQTLSASATKLMPPAQARHMFGLNTTPRDVSFANEPALWALIEANPTGYTSGWNGSGRQYYLSFPYRNLLLLVSGIQMAGPILTPETFEAALHRTTFPNPDHPNQPGKVRFTGGVHSMVMDAAEMWWDPSAESPYPDSWQPSGAFCYVDGGRRYRLGGWPGGRSPGLFSGPCDSGA